ncbi:copper amine oxidase N-terminal domain-containing protein [Paenibacillaceae bacterium]|nr:copper amine oxidase N-terminal domain-containing protein [Paenibacillaceae bacterium]
MKQMTTADWEEVKVKRFGLALILSVFLCTSLFQSQAQAAPPIKIYINGVELNAQQSPVMIGNRVLVPMRAMFEALNAKVVWNQGQQRVTATKGSTTISLTIGSSVAVINGQNVALDVPAKVINGGFTVVPVRFVSEALGQDVQWNSAAQTVTVTLTTEVAPVSNVNARTVSQQGDGSDLQVSFNRAQDESTIDHYRVLVVKAGNAPYFTAANADNVRSGNFTVINKDGRDKSFKLDSQTRDVDGALLQSGSSYAVFVLSVGNQDGNYNSALSRASSTVTVTGVPAVSVVNGLSVRDVSDFGDGRDLSVTFNKAQNEHEISNYRIFVVKSASSSSFNVQSANAVSSSNYTTVNKTNSGYGITTSLNSSARDTSGELIRKGVSYNVFVMSVSNNTNSKVNRLSSASSSITLTDNSPITAPVITKVEDVSDFGDGRDLLVNFNKSADESKVASYRIFVVKNNNASSFNLNSANSVNSNNYHTVSKTGANTLSLTLPSNMKDVQGAAIVNNQSYRVFLMAVGNDKSNYVNALSSASSAITLNNNFTVPAVTNVRVSDVGDNDDGRDLQVTFNKVADESKISHYRIFVVKSGNASRFNLNTANAVSYNNYTYVGKTGNNISTTLASGATDVDGAVIRSGVNYQVFVMSVTTANNLTGNALSQASANITLINNSASAPVNVRADIVDYKGNGSDLSVTFNKTVSDNQISSYRIMVVDADQANKVNGFTLGIANNVQRNSYTEISPNTTLPVRLSEKALDAQGIAISRDKTYKVYVLAVSKGSNNNALSAPSNDVRLQEPSVTPASNVNLSNSSTADALSLTVSFKTASNEANVGNYLVMLVPNVSPNNGQYNISNFDLTAANRVPTSNGKTVTKQGKEVNTSTVLEFDVNGNALSVGTTYRAYVLTLGNGHDATLNNLTSSPAHNDVTLDYK